MKLTKLVMNMKTFSFARTARLWIAVCMVLLVNGHLQADDDTSSSTSYAWSGNDISNLVTSSSDNATDVYLYNVATGYYMNQGGFWGTQPALRKVGIPVNVYSSVTENSTTYSATDGYYLKSGIDHNTGDDSQNTSLYVNGYIGYVAQGERNDSYPYYFDYGRLYMDRTPITASDYTGICDIGFSKVKSITSSTVYNITAKSSSDDDATTYYWTAVTDSGSLYIDLVEESALEARGDSAQWILVTLSDLQNAFDNADASYASPADATFLIYDQNFHRGNSDIDKWSCSTDGGSTTSAFSNTWGSTNFYYGMGYADNDSVTFTTTTTDDDGNETTTSSSVNNYWARLYGQYYAANIYNTSTAQVTQDVSISRSGWYRVSCAGFYVEPDDSSDDEETEDEETTTSNVLYVLGAAGGNWSWDTYNTLSETTTSGMYYGELTVAASAYIAFYTNITDQTKVSGATDDFYTAYRYGPAESETTNGDCYVDQKTNTSITLVNCSTANKSTSFYFSSAGTYYVTVDMSDTSNMTVIFSTTASTSTSSAAPGDDSNGSGPDDNTGGPSSDDTNNSDDDSSSDDTEDTDDSTDDDSTDDDTTTSGTMTAMLFATSSNTNVLNYSSSISLYHMGNSDGDALTASDINTANGYLQGGRLITNVSTQDDYENYVYVYVNVPENSTTTLTIGVKVTDGTGGWVCFDDVELAYVGSSTEYIVLDETDGALTYATTSDGTTTYSSFGLNDQLSNATTYATGNTAKSYTLALKRTMEEGEWNSLVLPVNLTYSQLQAAFGSDMYIAKLTGVTIYDSSNELIEFTTISSGDSLKYDSLYIIKPTTLNTTTYSDDAALTTPLPNSGSTTTDYQRSVSGDYFVIPQVSFPTNVTSYDKEISQTSIDAMSDDGGKITFYGTYIKQESRVPKGSYMIGKPSGDDAEWGFYHYTGTNALTVKGFRTWIQDNNTSTSSDVAATNLIFTIDGINDPTLSKETLEEVITHINSVTGETHATTADNRVFSLSGQLVREGTSLDGLAKGIYIVNGKKYIVR